MPLNHLAGLHMNEVLVKSNVEFPLWFTILGWMITIINIIANGVLIFIIKRHFLDNAHYWFTLSLATADLLIGFSIFPSMFFCNLSKTDPCNWHLQTFIYSSFIYVSVSSVATTIFGHYIIIAFPLKYARLLTSSRIWKMILISWTMPLFFGLLPLAWEDLRKETVLKATEWYFVCMLVIFEIIPFCVFLWIAIHLIKIVKTQKNKIQAQCNVQGRLSPPRERNIFHTTNIITKLNSCEVTEISQNQDSAFSISRQETAGEVNLNYKSFSPIAESVQQLNAPSSSKEDKREPSRSSYLNSLNNWLPSLPRRASTETRSSLDMSDFTSSFSLANSKDILNRIRIRQFRDQKHRSVLISCLLVVFMICYLLTLVNANCVFSSYCNEVIQSSNFKIITLFFELLNSTLNPILFILLGKDLRRKVAKLFCCKK